MNKFMIFYLIGIIITNSNGARILRDVSHGYNCNNDHGSGGASDFLQAPTIVSTASALPSTFTGNFNLFNAQTSFDNFSGKENLSGGNTQVNLETQQHEFYQQAPIITKHFYSYTAPVDHDEQQIVRYINIGRPQQNYRVVFIKTPSSSISRAKIIANVAPVEDKTAIYLLSKKSNSLDVTAEVNTPSPISHKPEVYYVKYHTPAEAEHYQHLVQKQYDSFGGSSQFFDGGLIPVSSAIGSLGGATAASEQSQSIANGVNIFGTDVNTQQQQQQQQQNYLQNGLTSFAG